MFDLRKIEAFCKVCEQRSFSRAGEALFLSQPTVSAHIQALEREFEVRLLDRMGRTVLPTPAGAILYHYAKQAFARLEAARAEIHTLSREVAGDLFIGSSSIPAHHVLPEVLAAFAEVHPKVKPSLTVASSTAITRLVLEGELMAGLVGESAHQDPDLLVTPVLRSEIVIIAPADLQAPVLPRPIAPPIDSPIDSSVDSPVDSPAYPVETPEAIPVDANADPLPEISLATAASLDWILREENSTTRKAFEEALRAAGHDTRQFHPRLVVDSSHAAVQYVRAGLGVSATARIAVQDALERGEIRAYRIAGVNAVRQFCCIMNVRRQPFPAANVFLEFLLAKTCRLRAME